MNKKKMIRVCFVAGVMVFAFSVIGEASTRTLTIQIEPNDPNINTVLPSPGVHVYDYGVTVYVEAHDYLKCPDVYRFDRWAGDVNSTSNKVGIGMLSDKTVRAIFVVGRKCGDQCHPYPASDLNKDCIVDLNDLSEFALLWLECTKPECD